MFSSSNSGSGGRTSGKVQGEGSWKLSGCSDFSHWSVQTGLCLQRWWDLGATLVLWMWRKKKEIWLKVNDLLSCTAAGLEKKSLRNRRREILIKTSPACSQWMHFNLNYTFLPLFFPPKIKLNQVIYILFIQTIQMQAINRAVLDEPQSCVWWRNHLNNRN